MSERVAVPGARDVRGVLDTAAADRVVVACPPHPRMGGSKADARLRAVSDRLGAHDVACLRFDYGPWDDGRGETKDAVAACQWARDRFDRVGLFGYSFGGGVALLAAREATPDALSVLAPAAAVGDRDAAALDGVECPLQVVYGERDDTADWAPIVEAARSRGQTVERIEGDHFFAGQHARTGDLVATWFAGAFDG
jgi:alpha/beta superfamily hydrolase